ncbi:zinc finger protein 62 homolog isoform X2 [Wyeomyia smithii]|uniref:zinc finger protein 62 homolog isoform X2 n=1 Tax=Wyeomyia smithii TaxID=174621 RepID=UPI0024681CC6|nr:zinc finger protein 62 homolog isoform X2 [Wyeomyia smithii]
METRSSANAPGMNVIAGSGPNICRICLVNGGSIGEDNLSRGMESIFSTIGEYEERSLYGILVTICVPLRHREMLRGMPERICRGCKWRLLSAFELYETCLRSDDKMRGVAAEMLKKQQQPHQQQESNTENDQVNIKQEVPDHDDAEVNPEVSLGLESFMQDSHYYPDAESTQMMMDQSTDLLEEMVPAVDPNESLFEEHYKLNEKGNHSCGICNQEFPYRSSARSHILHKHDPTKPFKCDVCHFTLTTELRLIRHKAITHGVGVLNIEEAPPDESSGDTIYTCKICSKTFNSVVRFKRHKNVHVVYNRPFKCDTCLYRFATRAQLNQHKKVHLEKPEGEADESEAGQEEWKCEHCEEKLPGKRAHTMHVRRFHPETLVNENKERNDYKCIICSEAFARESVLNTHMKMHELLAMEKEKEQRKELEMLIKQEMKSRKDSSVENTATEGGESNESNVANAGVEGSSSNVNNNNNINSGTAKKKSDVDVAFVCMVCEQEFEERDLLLKHQKKLHNELQLNIVPGVVDNLDESDAAGFEKDDELMAEGSKITPDEEPMVVDIDPNELLAQTQTENGTSKNPAVPPAMPKCHLCQKTFMYNCLLQTHLKKSHSELKPFECKVCRMRFGYRGTLQKHELTHSAQNVRPGGHGSIMYKCKICSAKFLELKSLSFHLRSHRSLTISTEPTVTKKIEIFQCSFCPQIFSEKEKYDEHLVKTHRQMLSQQQQQIKPALPVATQHQHARKNPEPRKLLERQPKDEKEMFLDSLAIIKVERT